MDRSRLRVSCSVPVRDASLLNHPRRETLQSNCAALSKSNAPDSEGPDKNVKLARRRCVVNPEGKLADGRVKLIQSCDVVPFKSKRGSNLPFKSHSGFTSHARRLQPALAMMDHMV